MSTVSTECRGCRGCRSVEGSDTVDTVDNIRASRLSTLVDTSVGSVEGVSRGCRLTPVSTVSTVSRVCRECVGRVSRVSSQGSTEDQPSLYNYNAWATYDGSFVGCGTIETHRSHRRSNWIGFALFWNLLSGNILAVLRDPQGRPEFNAWVHVVCPVRVYGQQISRRRTSRGRSLHEDTCAIFPLKIRRLLGGGAPSSRTPWVSSS